jgi:hypothetical protein
MSNSRLVFILLLIRWESSKSKRKGQAYCDVMKKMYALPAIADFVTAAMV